MSKTVVLMEVIQPIGTFYIGKIKAEDLISIYTVNRRTNNTGVQRKLSEKKVKEIAKYCEDPDATFPTPIVVSINTKNIKFDPDFSEPGFIKIQYDEGVSIAEVIDGQHRVEGIKRASVKAFELMIVVMFDLTEQEKAYVFSTVNANQKKMEKSLIYDLFEVSETRSPYKTCHELARTVNSSKTSPFYNKLKMLGAKEKETETLSQGTFVNYMVQHISKDPSEDGRRIKRRKKLIDDGGLIFRQYFIEEKDEVILKIILNYFGAVSEVFSNDWNNSKSILPKTTGYGALMKALPLVYEKGLSERDLSIDFFKRQFLKVKSRMENEGKEFTSDQWGAGEQAQRTLALYIQGIILG